MSVTEPARRDGGDARLNPAQQRVIDLLGKGAPRADLPDAVGTDLRTALEEELEPLVEHLGDEPLWISKHALATVHACEAHYVAALADPFGWTAANARGIVAHRAIELLVHWQGDPPPAQVVDETIARLTDEQDRGGIGGFLAGIGPYDRAELRGLAVDQVTAFTDCFPRLKPAWRPRTEARMRVELLDGRIILSGKVDLSLGRPGDKVIIDLKTGSARQQHREDLRFYALLETISLGLAPRKLASYYLDTATPHPEDVTEGVLRAALRRTVDGIHRIVDVRGEHREPDRVPGPQCNWCPVFDACGPGQAARAAFDAERG